ncbi:EAL and HDOD domain-containing protein [Billgrantia bachuensis]|uniref:EAL domain-containing protein n=1 Tax=Billgrantia bachuensis TaxID=2717286 RepID=A0ABX0PRQ9_9GAMM|nr:HDOD domain-containing protein [Halomonas bachuensis]NIC04254.1 EAL domain-containing protein [Halomonas bachuensis]
MSQGSDGADNLLLASQPIFDIAGNVRGVELLYRSDQGLSAFDVGEDIATAEVVYQLCTAISQRAGFYKAPAFINVSTDLLLSPHFLPVPPEHVVIELVERITPTTEMVETVRRLHRQGFRFALDDFSFDPEWAPLLPLASFIKIDTTLLSPEEAKKHRTRLEHLDIQWIAERVETREERDAYQDSGFELFQGYFYAKPVLVYGKKIPPSTLQATQLLRALCQPEPDSSEIIALIQSDPELAIKLTRISNNAFYRSHTTISSIQDVVARLGFQRLSSWVALFGLLGNASSEHAELALTRAKACELLAQQAQLSAEDAYFIGLLSTAELLLGVPGEEFLSCLELDTATSDALLFREGAYGSILQRIEGTERRYAMCQWELRGEDSHLLSLYHQAHHAAFELLTLTSTLE